MRHVGFTGTRRHPTRWQRQTLQQLLGALRYDGLYLHHGDCVGADAEAHSIAQRLGVDVVLHPPVDDTYRANSTGAVETAKPLPYLERNRAIVDSVESLVAVPRSMREELRSGTWATVRYAVSRSLPVTIIWPDGFVTYVAGDGKVTGRDWREPAQA